MPNKKPTSTSKDASVEKGKTSPTEVAHQDQENQQKKIRQPTKTDVQTPDVPAGAFDEDVKRDIDDGKENVA